MNKLLLLLPLIFSAPVVADEASGESAYKKYLMHIDNATEFIRLEDMDMACSEMRSASIVLMIKFKKLQQYKPGIDWFQSRIKNQKILDDLCTPYGDGSSILSNYFFTEPASVVDIGVTLLNFGLQPHEEQLEHGKHPKKALQALGTHLAEGNGLGT